MIRSMDVMEYSEDCAVETYDNFDIYAFKDWDGDRGNISEVINNVENRLNENLLKQNIKEKCLEQKLGKVKIYQHKY